MRRDALTCGHAAAHYARGLCRPCYQAARKRTTMPRSHERRERAAVVPPVAACPGRGPFAGVCGRRVVPGTACCRCAGLREGAL